MAEASSTFLIAFWRDSLDRQWSNWCLFDAIVWADFVQIALLSPGDFSFIWLEQMLNFLEQLSDDGEVINIFRLLCQVLISWSNKGPLVNGHRFLAIGNSS